LLRKPLNNPAIWFVENGLGLKKGLVARYLKIFVTFFLSGFIHLLPDLTAGITFSQSGALRFYCVQVLGIILEDGVQEIYRRAGGKEGKVWTKAGVLFGWPRFCCSGAVHLGTGRRFTGLGQGRRGR